MKKFAAIAAAVLGLGGVVGVGIATSADATPAYNTYYLEQDSTSVSYTGQVYVYCDSGDIATGGGFSWTNAQAGDSITESAPIIDGLTGNAKGWYVTAQTSSSTQRTLYAFANCVH